MHPLRGIICKRKSPRLIFEAIVYVLCTSRRLRRQRRQIPGLVTFTSDGFDRRQFQWRLQF